MLIELLVTLFGAEAFDKPVVYLFVGYGVVPLALFLLPGQQDFQG